MALQHFFGAAIEALDHAIGLSRLGRREAMLDVEGCADLTQLVCALRCALAQAEEAIREFFAIIRKNCADAQQAAPLQVTKEATGVGGGLDFEDADEDPVCCEAANTSHLYGWIRA